MNEELFTINQQAVFFSTIKELNKEIHHVKHVDKLTNIEGLFKNVYSQISKLSTDVDKLFSIVFEGEKMNIKFFSEGRKKKEESEYKIIRALFVNKLIISCRKSQSIDDFIKDVKKIVFQFLCIGYYLESNEKIVYKGKEKNSNKAEPIVDFKNKSIYFLQSSFEEIIIEKLEEEKEIRSNEEVKFMTSVFSINLHKNHLLNDKLFSDDALKAKNVPPRFVIPWGDYGELRNDDFHNKLEKVCKKIKERRLRTIGEVSITLQKIKEWQEKRTRLSILLRDRCGAKSKRLLSAIAELKHYLKKLSINNKKKEGRSLLDVLEEYKLVRSDLDSIKENIYILNYEANKYKSIIKHLSFNCYPTLDLLFKDEVEYEKYGVSKDSISPHTKQSLKDYELFCRERVSMYISYFSNNDVGNLFSAQCFENIKERIITPLKYKNESKVISRKGIEEKIREVVKSQPGKGKVDLEMLYNITTESHCLLSYHISKSVDDLIEDIDEALYKFLKNCKCESEILKNEINRFLDTPTNKENGFNEFLKTFSYSSTYYKKYYESFRGGDFDVRELVINKIAEINNRITPDNDKIAECFNLEKDIIYYCEFVSNYFDQYLVTLNKHAIIKYDTLDITNNIFAEQLEEYDGHSFDFRKIINKIGEIITKYFVEDVSNYKTSAINFNESKWKLYLFNEIKFDLSQLFLGQYDLLNAFLHSKRFTHTTDSLQVYGGGFGIWDLSQDELVRIQDSRYCHKDYRPVTSEYLISRGERWYSISERYLDHGKWIRNRLEETIGLSFYTQRKHYNKPEFFQNLISSNNVLNVIEKENSCLFAEDGEVSAFILLYRFLDGIFHTKNYKKAINKAAADKTLFTRNKLGELYFDIISKESSQKKLYIQKENKFKTFVQGICLLIYLSPFEEKEGEGKGKKISDFDMLSIILLLIEFEPNKEIQRENYKIAEMLCALLLGYSGSENGLKSCDVNFEQLIKEKGRVDRVSKKRMKFEARVSRYILKTLSGDYPSLIKGIEKDEINKLFTGEYQLSFSQIELVLNELIDENDIKIPVSQENENEIRIENICSNLQGFIDGVYKEEIKKRTIKEKDDNVVYRILQDENCDFSLIELFVEIFKFLKEIDDYSTIAKKIQEYEMSKHLFEENLEDIKSEEINLEKKISEIRVRLKYLKLFRRMYYALIYYLIGDVDLYKMDFSFSVKKPNVDIKNQGFSPLEDQGRVEKFKSDIAKYVNQPALSTLEYSANLVSELKRQGLAHGIGKEEANIEITERYINLCKYIEKELNSEKKRFKTKCDVPLETLNPLNEEKYFIDKRLKKYEIFKDSRKGVEFFQKREKYLEKIREAISGLSTDINYQTSYVNKFKYYDQVTRIIILLLESVEKKFTSSKFINLFYNDVKVEGNLSKSWNEIREHIDEMSKFPLDAYYIWRLNSPYALSGLALPLATSGTNKDAPNVGFVMLGFRNIFDGPNGEKVHITHDTKELFKEYMLTIRSIFQPLIHPLLDRIYYGQIFNKAVKENAIHAAVSRVMSRNLSHNMGSHVLDSISNISHQESKALSHERVTLGGSVYLRKDVSKIASFLRTRMGFIADVSTGKSFFSVPYDFASCFDDLAKMTIEKIIGNNRRMIRIEEKNEARFQKIILDFISGNSDFNSENIHIFPITRGSNPISIALPNGNYGMHALNLILENIIRNAVKHSGLKSSSNKVLAIRVVADALLEDSDFVEVSILPEFMTKEEFNENKKKNKFSRNIKSFSGETPFLVEMESAEQDKEKEKEINRIIEENTILDDNGIALRKDNWGILEMKVAAAYLRTDELTRIDELSKVHKKHKNLLNVRVSNNVASYSLYIPIPKKIEIVLVKNKRKDVVLDDTYKILFDILQRKDDIKVLRNNGMNIKEVKAFDELGKETKYEIQLVIGLSRAKDDFTNRFHRHVIVEDSSSLKELLNIIKTKGKNINEFPVQEIINYTWKKRAEDLNAYDEKIKYDELIYVKEIEDGYVNIFSHENISKSKLRDEIERNKVVLFDHHTKVFKREEEDEKLFTQLDEEIIDSFCYYEPYESIDPTGLLINNVISNDVSFRYELAETVYTQVLVIDERIQKEISLKKSDGDFSDGKKFIGTLNKMGIYTLDKEDLDTSYSNSDEKEYLLEDIIHTIKSSKRNRFDFVIIHISIIEKIVGTLKENITDFINEIIKEVEKENKSIQDISEKIELGQIVLISERGTPSNMPDKLPFIPYSIVKRFLVTQCSKFYLIKTLYATSMDKIND